MPLTTAMPSEQEFQDILRKAGLPPAYVWDGPTLEAQQRLPGTLDALPAFAAGIEALTQEPPQGESRDSFLGMVRSQPESFALPAQPTEEELRQAVLAGLRSDRDLTFQLLPENPQIPSDAGGLFPPEYSESVQDFWIWVVRSPGFFPGPAWILVQRNGGMPAYHYGYL